MYRNPDYKFIDFKIFLAYIGLMFLGLYSIYVVEYDSKTTFSFYSEFGKQILFHLISLTIGVIILLLDVLWYLYIYTFPIYLLRFIHY